MKKLADVLYSYLQTFAQEGEEIKETYAGTIELEGADVVKEITILSNTSIGIKNLESEPLRARLKAEGLDILIVRDPVYSRRSVTKTIYVPTGPQSRMIASMLERVSALGGIEEQGYYRLGSTLSSFLIELNNTVDPVLLYTRSGEPSIVIKNEEDFVSIQNELEQVAKLMNKMEEKIREIATSKGYLVRTSGRSIIFIGEYARFEADLIIEKSVFSSGYAVQYAEKEFRGSLEQVVDKIIRRTKTYLGAKRLEGVVN
jgi:PHD/YefM family antitoxin component YafN of YafNO toxin-antitoxin module